jgi:hypothetical protein
MTFTQTPAQVDAAHNLLQALRRCGWPEDTLQITTRGNNLTASVDTEGRRTVSFVPRRAGTVVVSFELSEYDNGAFHLLQHELPEPMRTPGLAYVDFLRIADAYDTAEGRRIPA